MHVLDPEQVDGYGMVLFFWLITASSDIIVHYLPFNNVFVRVLLFSFLFFYSGLSSS